MDGKNLMSLRIFWGCGLEEGDVVWCEVVRASGSAPKLSPPLQLYLFDLCTPRQVVATGDCIELCLQQ